MRTGTLFLLALAGCGGHTRELRLQAAQADACAGVVLVRLVFEGLGSATTRTLLMDPGRAACDFGPEVVIEGVQPGSGRRVTIDGRDSTGQPVLSGQSPLFDDPPASSASTLIAVSRSSVPVGTALFTFPERAGVAVVGVGANGSSALLVSLESEEARAWGVAANGRRLAVTGIDDTRLIYAIGMKNRERELASPKLECPLGTLDKGWIVPGKSGTGECALLKPTP